MSELPFSADRIRVNAILSGMLGSLIEAFESVERDGDTRKIALTGTGAS